MENIKKLIPDQIRDYISVVSIGVCGAWILLKIGNKIFTKLNQNRMLSRWKKTPKDVVIVHRFPAGTLSPNASPFVIKVETYLRMAKIPYEVDERDYMSVKGKCPWITLNGEHIADSQLCVDFLKKKFGKKLGNYSDEQRAIGTMARITMDEHFYWGLILWRYVYTKGRDCHKFLSFPMPRIMFNLLIRSFVGKLEKASWFQGSGRHTKEDVIRVMCEDLRALSKFIGNKKFLLGDEPCEDDAAVFGQLVEIVWCCPNSPYEKLINDELKNLKDYSLRMKDSFWPDWENCLAGGGKNSKKNN